MPYLLENLGSITEVLRRTPFGLITDVDGTISNIAPTPQAAKVWPPCRHALAILVKHLALVAAISGRPAVEVRNMVKVDGVVYIGNHGMEHWDEGNLKPTEDIADYSAVITATIDELTPVLSRPDIILETKGITATIHYRLCPNHQAARREILAALKKATPAKRLRIMSGKMSINLLPPVDINKGTAVIKLIKAYSLRAGVYLGDEVTDIDAFKAIHSAARNSEFQGFTIGVTSREMPKRLRDESDFTLNGIDDVACFLEWLSQTVPPIR